MLIGKHGAWLTAGERRNTTMLAGACPAIAAALDGMQHTVLTEFSHPQYEHMPSLQRLWERKMFQKWEGKGENEST